MDAEQLVEKLVLWIREKVEASGCRGVVLGMSGGIDSSVAAVLCKRAFPQNTFGLIMPCYSIPEDEEHALMVAGKFSIPTQKVVLDSVFDALLKVLPEEADSATDRMAKVNLKVRLRMLTLYYYANQKKYVVVGPSNRSELTVGYFTKHGDSGVDIMPIGNLVKAQVRELAIFLGIPKQIIDKPPSAGLWPGQTDEYEMDLSYEELDYYLVSGEAKDRVRTKIESMRISSKHKLFPPSLPPF